MPVEGVYLFGIRHHGPGSARSLRRALHALAPDCLLVEGPPEGNALLPLAIHEDMRPPVALLIYGEKDPSLAAYYPFTVFSPEWQAFQYGLRQKIPVSMMDLPQGVQLVFDQNTETGARKNRALTSSDLPATLDPLHQLAEAAGYSDSELWWEQLVEQRRGHGDVFAAIHEAICAVRGSLPPETDPLALRREAAMRQQIRLFLARGFGRIAVVCGAWHLPALDNLDNEEEDLALLRGLAHTRVLATWTPWSNNRLTRRSGYGAGITSPAWYYHLWDNEDWIAERWMVRVANLLREEAIDVAPGSVIDAVRLAETLAALRGQPIPGLHELQEASLSVFCFGNPLPLQLIEEKLIVGEAFGAVPSETPMSPLQADLEHEIKRLRMKLKASEELLDLDLRERSGQQRSHLLHRLNMLNIPWGRLAQIDPRAPASSRSGSFHEIWRINWKPEYAIGLLEAGVWGNTIAEAAETFAIEQADRIDEITRLTGLVKNLLLADLPRAVDHVMDCLQTYAAVSHDVPHLMDALIPLADVLRYSSVREIDRAALQRVVDGLITHICLGLEEASTSINEEAAEIMFLGLTGVHDAIQRLGDHPTRERWLAALLRLLNNPQAHGLLAGRACRILLNAEAIAAEESVRQLSLGLSPSTAPVQSAAWLEGFLRGSGQILIHDTLLMACIDQWVSQIPAHTFTQILPVLRRTFAGFSKPERRALGEQVRSGSQEPAAATDEWEDPNFDRDRGNLVLPVVMKLLGIEEEPNE